jgi:hypothetical protein
VTVAVPAAAAADNDDAAATAVDAAAAAVVVQAPLTMKTMTKMTLRSVVLIGRVE